MRRFQSVLIFIICASAFAADDQLTPGATGDFTKIHFTQRSPLSSVKELSARFAQKNLSPDYDLGSEEFLAHVPGNYDPQKPLGLIVLINYKDTAALPTPVLPLLDEKNLAFIAQNKSSEKWWVRCGVALDEVHNMQQLYKIDPVRTYIFSFTNDDECGLRLFTSYSDVFNGALLCQEYKLWMPVKAANNSTYPAKLPHPPAKYLAAAKLHPLEIVSQNELDYLALVTKALKSDGFRHLKTGPIDKEDYHYPYYKIPWLTEVLTFLDENAPMPKMAATHPASKPAG